MFRAPAIFSLHADIATMGLSACPDRLGISAWLTPVRPHTLHRMALAAVSGRISLASEERYATPLTFPDYRIPVAVPLLLSGLTMGLAAVELLTHWQGCTAVKALFCLERPMAPNGLSHRFAVVTPP